MTDLLNQDRFFRLPDDFYAYGTSLEVNKILGDLNRGSRPVMLSDILKAFDSTEAAERLKEVDRIILPDERYFLNVREEWSEKEQELLIPKIVVCFIALC